MTDEPDPVVPEALDTQVEMEPPKTRKRTKTGQFEPTMAIDNYEDAIRELREENAKLRKRQEADSQQKAEKLAEERVKLAKEEAVKAAQEQLAEFKAEMLEMSKQRVLKSELKAAAIRAGVIDFDDLFAVMRNLDEVKYSDDGEIINAGELITAIKEKKPHLFIGTNISSTAAVPRTPSRAQPMEKPALTMSREDYERSKRMLNDL